MKKWARNDRERKFQKRSKEKESRDRFKTPKHERYDRRRPLTDGE